MFFYIIQDFVLEVAKNALYCKICAYLVISNVKSWITIYKKGIIWQILDLRVTISHQVTSQML